MKGNLGRGNWGILRGKGGDGRCFGIQLRGKWMCEGYWDGWMRGRRQFYEGSG